MSCWCDEIKNYKCFECEDIQPPKEPEMLKAYLRLVVNDRFDSNNAHHRELMATVISNGDDMDNLTNNEVRQLKE